ncbi:MAG: stearoyl-CoA desaturase (delta-9 desaturase) [Gammaproteobacteria bacterium]
MRGFLNGHTGWVIRHDVPRSSRYAPDLAKDAVAIAVRRYYGWFVLLGIVLPAAAGAWYYMSISGAVIGTFWGGFVRLAVGHQIIWAVNSVGHFFGRRPYDTGCKSADQWLLAVPYFGESWHNNHHRPPHQRGFTSGGGSSTWDGASSVGLHWPDS